jgi:hypothetical protein
MGQSVYVSSRRATSVPAFASAPSRWPKQGDGSAARASSAAPARSSRRIRSHWERDASREQSVTRLRPESRARAASFVQPNASARAIAVRTGAAESGTLRPRRRCGKPEGMASGGPAREGMWCAAWESNLEPNTCLVFGAAASCDARPNSSIPERTRTARTVTAVTSPRHPAADPERRGGARGIAGTSSTLAYESVNTTLWVTENETRPGKEAG